MQIATGHGGGALASCGYPCLHAEDMQDSLEMIDPHGEPPVPSYLCQASGQKVPMIHPPFHRPKGMFHQALPRVDLLGLCRDSLRHLLHNGLVHPSSHPAIFLIPGALGFAGACCTSCGRVLAKVSTMFDGVQSKWQLLGTRAALPIFGSGIEEIFFAKEASLTIGRGVGLRNRRNNPSLQTLLDFITIVVAHISHRVYLRRF